MGDMFKFMRTVPNVMSRVGLMAGSGPLLPVVLIDKQSKAV